MTGADGPTAAPQQQQQQQQDHQQLVQQQGESHAPAADQAAVDAPASDALSPLDSGNASGSGLGGAALKDDALEDYVKFMRRELCPAEMIETDGALRQAYFQPKAEVTATSCEDASLEQLQTGLAELGVGAWAAIKSKHLQLWDELAIRLRTCALMGSQDLSAYDGKKMDKAAIAAAHASNKEAALKEGTWHHGVRVSKRFGNLV